MGWDVSLSDHQGATVEVGRHQEGGTYAVGGTAEAAVSITYNYGKHFREAWPDDPDREGSGVLRRMLDGKQAGETISTLERAVAQLGTMRDPDYWQPTPGNAGAMLAVLLGWARLHPDGVWHVD